MTILLEQEVKFRLESAERGRALAEAFGAEVTKPRHFEANILFDGADERITKRDEALRVRRVSDDAWLTWKGPQHGSGRIKQRRELETFLSDGDAALGILEALGLVECFRYEKYRTTYRVGDDAVLTLDETPIGVFIEIEAAPDRIAELAGRAGLDMSDAIQLSYPRLYERHRMETPEAPQFMVFSETPPLP